MVMAEPGWSLGKGRQGIEKRDQLQWDSGSIAGAVHHDGMATLERAAVMMYRPGNRPAVPLQLVSLLNPLSTLPNSNPAPP